MDHDGVIERVVSVAYIPAIRAKAEQKP